MELTTTRFGKITFDQNRVISMKRGLIGFADRRRFVILSPAPGSTLLWYQSVDDPGLAFVITSPKLFVPDYEFPFNRFVLESLEAEDSREVEVYVLVTIPAGRPKEMTGNMLGPLVINPTARLAEQMIVDDTKYSHKQPLCLQSPK